MEELRGPTEAHILQGPHRDLHPETPPGFFPLRLQLEPVGLAIEVHRAEAVIGRHSHADVRLALPDISRRHCRLVFENQQWRMLDLESLNGVFVNGERMAEANLYDGDRLQLGQFTFLVEYASPTAQPADPKKEVLKSIAEAMKEQKWAS